MVYTILVLALRKEGIKHSEFISRYESHMQMVTGLAGDTAPLSHIRLYPKHDSATDRPILVAGNANDMPYSAAVMLDFGSEQDFHEFTKTLLEPEANAKITADEEGFWEREGMKVMVVDRYGG